jgi:type II secretory pathway pseudopilin PulG
MIELIFAITIMGIVMLSAPLLIDRSSKSSFVALQQESIAAVATQINMIMTAEWDQADTNSTLGTPVLQTGSTSIANCTTPKPIGVTATNGRYCIDKDSTLPLSSPLLVATAPGSLGTDVSDLTVYNDIDDYTGQSYTVSVYNSENYATYEGDYLDQDINVTSNIYYGDDTPRDVNDNSGAYQKTTTFSNPFRHKITANSTNIKLIQVTLTSGNMASEISNKQIILTAFMCNIGAPKKQYRNNRPRP